MQWCLKSSVRDYIVVKNLVSNVAQVVECDILELNTCVAPTPEEAKVKGLQSLELKRNSRCWEWVQMYSECLAWLLHCSIDL